MKTKLTWPISEYFELQQVAQGVYAAIVPQGGVAIGNAGIVDLGGRTIIFDTFETPKAAQDLRRAAEHLTARPASYVINSHAHPDHWFGNQVFNETVIVATPPTREHMAAFAENVRASQEDPTEMEDFVRQERARLEAETDAARRALIERSIARWQAHLEVLPTLELRFPDLVFEGKLTLHGTQRTVELVTFGPGHTGGDCFLLLPQDRLVFLGDLGFFGRQPFMADCEPEAWRKHLAEVEGWQIDTFVPGHGPVGSKADLVLQRQYIALLEKQVAEGVAAGQPVEALLERRLPAPFDGWSVDGRPQEINVQVLYQRASDAMKSAK